MNGHGRSKITAFRLSEDDRALFARAAKAAGETLSTFLCTAGRERARRLLGQ